MTIASEITRIQGAKADIRQAIIDKGVDVGAGLTIDEYACCIAEIKSGGGGIPGIYAIDYILVGGGGSGSGNGYGGGGGGGAVCLGTHCLVFCDNICVTIGNGGASVCGCSGCNGGNSSICGECLSIIACGGMGGCGYTSGQWCCCQGGGWSGSGYHGGDNSRCAGGGGGGAGGYGCNATNDFKAGNGGLGKCGYGGGGGGYAYTSNSACRAYGCCGGGNGGYSTNAGCPATTCGSGGGSGGWSGSRNYPSGAGAKGISKICYPIDGSYGFTTATGGNSCCLDNGYCVHEFTSDGTFCITG